MPKLSAAELTVLIVDDSRTNVVLLQGILGAEGFRTLTADCGRSARELIGIDKPDLILLDVIMPGETGFETCAKLKSNRSTADIPIIFLSALDDVKSKVTGLKVGGVDYIAKPLHGEEVLARVRVHLRIAETNRLLIQQSRERLEALRNAQRAILVRPEDCPEARFSVHYEPLEEASGDFYDVVDLYSDTFGYFVADVSGHGASAAFLTSAIKALLRQYAGPLYSPEDLMRGVDSVMRQLLGEEQYLTACYARLNRQNNRLSIISAGHPPLIVISANGTAQVVEMDSNPLGVFSSLALHRKDLRLSPGDRFFLYTDGLIESSPGGGRKEGMELLVDACRRDRMRPLTGAASRIAEELRPSDQRAEDDLLLLAVEIPAVL